MFSDDFGRKCCFTGYRPSKFPFSLDREDKDYKKFENSLIDGIMSLARDNCRVFYSGMAMGFDIIAAEIVLMLKDTYETPLKLICVLPFENQSEAYTSYWRKRYEKILRRADEVIVLDKDYSQGCYQKRNVYMVDNSDYVLTWYDGKFGGTRNTLDYAAEKGRYIFNVNGKGADSFGVQTSMEIL
jgi:uncharacterized phage-like protein YoqJ